MKKCISLFFSLFVVLAFVACGTSFPAESSVVLEGEKLLALNNSALKNATESGSKSTMYFSFTSAQRHLLLNRIKNTHSSVSLGIVLEKTGKTKNPEDTVYSYGFLTDDDFNESGTLYSSLESRYLVQGDIREFEKEICLEFSVSDISSAVSIAGFFVHSEAPVKLKSVYFADSRVGFSLEESCSVFAFGPKGGVVVFDPSDYDFTNASFVFNNESAQKYIMPYISVGFYDTDDIGVYDNQKSVYIQVGSEKLRLRRTRNSNESVIQGSSLLNLYSHWKFDSSKDQLKSLMMYENDVKMYADSKVLYPIPSDLGLILDWNQNNWRCEEYELFQWDLFPEVLFFDFKDYAIQSQFLTRLAYFVEKEGYKGTFISDEDVVKKHGYNAHDYKAVDLAKFYSEAFVQNFSLNKRELLLKEILLKNGVIVSNNDGTYSEGKGCLISIARESNSGLRYRLIAHEAWHGVYFGNEEFRDLIDVLYDSFNPMAMNYIKRYWTCTKDLSYDLNDDYLMRNEFMAYIMQQNLASVQQYILSKSNWRNKVPNDQILVDYVTETEAQDFYNAGVRMNDYVFNKWGFAAGRLSLITKEVR